MAVLDLRFCARAFSSCGKRGPLFIMVHGPLTITASLVAEHRLQTHRLSNCGSRAHLLRGMWDPPRSNPCPLHWQADPQPLRHQGSPRIFICIPLSEIMNKVIPSTLMCQQYDHMGEIYCLTLFYHKQHICSRL